MLQEDERPVDIEDKWGKQNQPQHSVDLSLIQDGTFVCASKTGKMPVKLTNFTIEFWLKTSQETREFTLSVASKGIDLTFKGQ